MPFLHRPIFGHTNYHDFVIQLIAKNGRFCKIVPKRVIIDLSCLSGMFVLYVGYVVCDQTRPDKSIETTPIIDKLLTSFSQKVLAVTISRPTQIVTRPTQLVTRPTQLVTRQTQLVTRHNCNTMPFWPDLARFSFQTLFLSSKQLHNPHDQLDTRHDQQMQEDNEHDQEDNAHDGTRCAKSPNWAKISEN